MTSLDIVMSDIIEVLLQYAAEEIIFYDEVLELLSVFEEYEITKPFYFFAHYSLINPISFNR